MFRPSGRRFADKNMRQIKKTRACSDSEGSERALASAATGAGSGLAYDGGKRPFEHQPAFVGLPAARIVAALRDVAQIANGRVHRGQQVDFASGNRLGRWFLEWNHIG